MSKKNLNYYLNLVYDVIVHKEKMDEETWYTAYCKELGKFSCYGKGETPADAIESFNEQKADFITYLFEEGKEIPEPNCINEVIEKYSGFFNVRTSPVIHAKLIEQANNMDISMNLYLNQILSAAVEKKGIECSLTDLIKDLQLQLESHHYEVTNQLKYQKEITLEHTSWHLEYQEGHSTMYMSVA